MNKLPYIVFSLVFTLPFLWKFLRILPKSIEVLFELTSGLIFLTSLVYGAYHKSLSVNAKYLILFFFVCVHFLTGAVINSEDMFPLFLGARYYLKYTPLFILPLVYRFTDKDMKNLFIFFISIGIVQCIIAFIQRFILSTPRDWVAGTLGIGSIMSLYLVCCVVILIAFYLKGRISPKTFAILALVLFAPTTINETKGTIVLIIVGIPVVMMGVKLTRSQIAMSLGALTLMLVMFTVVYNQSYTVGGGNGLLDFFADSDSGLSNYLYSGDSLEEIPLSALDETGPVIGALPQLDPDNLRTRRLDAVILPFRVLSADPVKLLVGLGIGNTSASSIPGFSGYYSFLDEFRISLTALPNLAWEIGVIGLLLYLLFFIFIYRDARQLSKEDSLSGVFALGWAGVVVIIIATLPYKNIFFFEAPCALFWFFSGYIAAEHFRLHGHVISHAQRYGGG